MNKETFDLVEKIFTFLKVEDFNKLKNFLTAIEKDYLNYYKIFENFKEKRIGEKVSDVFGSLTLGGTPLDLLGKKAEKAAKEKEFISKKSLLKNEISEILKNYSDVSEEKKFLEFLLEKI